MPDHVHGIIIINKQDGIVGGGIGRGGVVGTPNLGVPTTPPPTAPPTPPPTTKQTDAASAKWKPGTLGVIMNQYKRICTIESRKINRYFAWQSRFYDHIIRDAMEFERIQNYIANNPRNWKDYKLNS